MISAKPMAVVTMLALAGGAVAQERVDEQSELPSAIDLLREVSRERPLEQGLGQIVETFFRFDAGRANRPEVARACVRDSVPRRTCIPCRPCT